VGGYWKWKGSEMWIMVEPIAEIPFGIHRSLTWCYRCNIDKPVDPPLVHPFINIPEAQYISPSIWNFGAPAEKDKVQKEKKPAYRMITPIQNPKIAEDVYS
jgi:hypothetical protein